MGDYGTWWKPTLAGIEKAYEQGDFGYDVSPTIGLLLRRRSELEQAVAESIARLERSACRDVTEPVLRDLRAALSSEGE